MVKPRQFKDEGYSIGQYLKLYKRIQNQLEKREEAAHQVRVNLGDKIVELTPTFANKNIEPGTAAGAIMAVAAMWIDEYVPMAADTEIVDSEKTDQGTRYTVDVDAPFPQQGKFRAMMEAGEGFPSLLVDDFDITEEDVMQVRAGRDTYQYDVLIKDNTPENPKSIGFGLLDITETN